MGAIFGSDKEFSPNFTFDLTSQPTSSEKVVYDQLQVVIDNHNKIIDQMKAYKGKAKILVKSLTFVFFQKPFL